MLILESRRPCISSKAALVKEVEFVIDLLKKCDCEVVFNHGDTNPRNMIYNPDTGE